ncbi:MAG: pantoate--beta-alanine ligase [Chloroflexi bacterium RBG_13_50_21]|nr:MAG: pantoate--beta-alanine ligase [Chloroflexi bacterium RBG_13_50_21]
MIVVESLEDLRLTRNGLIQPVGLVPTMGSLHEGHLSLVRQARQECASVSVSIYVNPTQFGPHEDLKKYPRDLQRDLDLLQSEGVDLVWTPSDNTMYPHGYQTWVVVEEVTRHLEGVIRAGHFRGVATVVSKLFIAIQPQKAYFGQKDAQQAVVIRQMAHDLNFPIEIVVCPTIREPDGLAMSSRNVYLDPEERRAAVVLSRGLFKAKASFEAGERDASHLREIVLDTLATEPLVKVQYVSCATLDTLQELEGSVDRALISLAVTVGDTRLIDNIII